MELINNNILSGVRVLDLTRVMSGPFCTSMLADLGAEIIKIEMPETGDDSRFIGPFKNNESAYFMLLNRSKKSVTVDMKTKQGRALIDSLIPQCDVIIENFRPGVMSRLGLDEPSIRKLNSSIIYTSISGFGQNSPMKDWPAFDLIIQAMSGLMSLTGPKDGPETAAGESLADVCSGMFAAFGTVAALFDRQRTGIGRHLDVAMLDSMFSIQLTGLARQLYMNDTPKPAGNRHPITYPVDTFPAKNGNFVMVCFSQKAFLALCNLMNNKELAVDPRFVTNHDRNQNEEELRKIITAWSLKLDQEQAIKLLLEAGVPAAPVWNLHQLVNSPYVKTRGLVVTGNHTTLGEIPLVPQPIKFSNIPEPSISSSPTLGQHTQEVLRDLVGLNNEDIEQLSRDKII